jgi:hypothetical protein
MMVAEMTYINDLSINVITIHRCYVVFVSTRTLLFYRPPSTGSSLPSLNHAVVNWNKWNDTNNKYSGHNYYIHQWVFVFNPHTRMKTIKYVHLLSTWNIWFLPLFLNVWKKNIDIKSCKLFLIHCFWFLTIILKILKF